MVDRLRAAIPPQYVIKPTRSTQPRIPLGSVNRAPLKLRPYGAIQMSILLLLPALIG